MIFNKTSIQNSLGRSEDNIGYNYEKFMIDSQYQSPKAFKKVERIIGIKKDTLLKNEEEKLFNRGKIRLEDKEWQYKGIDDNFGDSSYE